MPHGLGYVLISFVALAAAIWLGYTARNNEINMERYGPESVYVIDGHTARVREVLN